MSSGIAVLIVEHFVTTAHDILSRNLSKSQGRTQDRRRAARQYLCRCGPETKQLCCEAAEKRASWRNRAQQIQQKEDEEA